MFNFNPKLLVCNDDNSINIFKVLSVLAVAKGVVEVVKILRN